DRPGAAAVLVHARAHVERRIDDVVWEGRATHDDRAILARPLLEPVDRVAVEPHVGQADRALDDQRRGDRRLPGAVGGNGHAKPSSSGCEGLYRARRGRQLTTTSCHGHLDASARGRLHRASRMSKSPATRARMMTHPESDAWHGTTILTV